MFNNRAQKGLTRRAFIQASAGAIAGLVTPASAQPSGNPLSTVDCSQNPFDIRPALGAITQTENWILSRLPEDRTLIVLFGEMHQRCLDGVLQWRLLQAIVKDRDANPAHTLAAGWELPHTAFQHNGLLNPAEKSRQVTALEKLNPGNAVPRLQAMKDCLANDVPLAFNDLANKRSDGQYVLDQADDFTRAVIARHYPSLSAADINVAGKDGVLLRNLGIVERAAYHILETSAKIYYQQCGAEHLFGSPEGNIFGRSSDYKDNLSYLFEQRGFAVLVVEMPYYKNRVSLSAQAAAQGYTLPALIKPTGLNADAPQTREAQRDLMSKIDFNSGLVLSIK